MFNFLKKPSVVKEKEVEKRTGVFTTDWVPTVDKVVREEVFKRTAADFRALGSAGTRYLQSSGRT